MPARDRGAKRETSGDVKREIDMERGLREKHGRVRVAGGGDSGEKRQ
jgi:hypothetical protein